VKPGIIGRPDFWEKRRGDENTGEKRGMLLVNKIFLDKQRKGAERKIMNVEEQP